MRIISGSYKGRNLVAPSGLNVRPTTDFAKESFFNIINTNFYFEDVNFLELFAGFGSISIEFASRGCKSITTVEINQKCCDFIQSNVKKFEIDGLKLMKANAFRYLESCHQTFDIIFADPPYDLQGIETIPEIIFSRNLLNANGWLVLEHGPRIDFKQFPQLFDQRHYGKVNFSFFKNLE